MHENGFTPEQIADITGKTTEEVEAIMAEQEPVVV